MEIRTTDEVIEQINGFAYELLEKQLEKKRIDEEIKEMKQTWKEEGVSVSKVTKVLTRLKARAKLNEADKLEEDILEEKLEANTEIQDRLAMLC